MSHALVTQGQRYFYNPNNEAIYPWAPDLERVPGLLAFVAPQTGAFTMGMTLAQAQQTAQADVEQKQKESALAKLRDEAEKLLKEAKVAVQTDVEKFGEDMRNLGHKPKLPTLAPTATPE